MKQAVIFDVDGPLLELTTAEEDCFFAPLKARFPNQSFSRDWNSYPVRNDLLIYRHILATCLRREPRLDELDDIMATYIAALSEGLALRKFAVTPVAGAASLVGKLAACRDTGLGIATANLREAARLRLSSVNLWTPLQSWAGSAEFGGAKAQILASLIDQMPAGPDHVVFLGDNLNDLEAARHCAVRFIGFSSNPSQRDVLRQAGASYVTGDHEESWAWLQAWLDLL